MLNFNIEQNIQKIILEEIGNTSLFSLSDLEGNIIGISNELINLLGYNKSDIMGENHSILRYGIYEKEFYKNMWDTILSKKTYNEVLKCKTSKGGVKYFDTSILPIVLDGKIVNFLATRKDITEQVYRVRYDDLTNLRSRKNLQEYLENNKGKYFCGSILNIDSFSNVNDLYGGDYGNKLLQEVAKRLVENNEFFVYKLLADEYMIIKKKDEEENLEDFKNNIEKIKEITNQITKEKFQIEELSLKIRITAGITCSLGSDILLHTNTALKKAKATRKKSITFQNSMIDVQKKERNMQILQHIHSALDNNNILLHYQPIVSNKTQEIVKYEALARLRDTDNLIIPPCYFLSLSQKAKLYNELSRGIIKKSFSKFKDLNISFSINLSREDIENIHTMRVLTESLEQYKYPKNVTIEIIETEDFEDYNVLKTFVKKMRFYGAKVAIDDFGSKNSNFSHLANIDFDYIKIDGQFVSDIIENPIHENIVETIVAFAKKHGIKTIAEYVETEEIFLLLKKIGVDYSQGYYFGKPKEDLKIA